MKSYINVSNINTQFKGICCSNTTKLSIKKITLYSSPILLHQSSKCCQKAVQTKQDINSIYTLIVSNKVAQTMKQKKVLSHKYITYSLLLCIFIINGVRERDNNVYQLQ